MSAIRLLCCLTIAIGLFVSDTEAQTGPLQYYALTPCRLVDTRNATGLNGGPALAAGPTRNFAVQGRCGVPVGAKAVTLNVTIVLPTGASHVTLWPSGQPLPTVSTINFTQADSALANGAIVPLSANLNADLSAQSCCASVHLVLDVTGYFQ